MMNLDDKLEEWKGKLEQAKEYAMFVDDEAVSEMIETIEKQHMDIQEWERISNVKDSHLVRNGKQILGLIDEKATLEAEIERLQEDCAHWKMKWRDLADLDEDEV